MIATKTILFAFLGVLIATCTTARAQTDQVPNAWGEPVDRLQIAIYFDPNKQNMRPEDVRLALRNVGTAKITVTLGGGCGDYSPTQNVILFLTDSQGKTQRLDDISGSPVCAGALSIFSVPISPGAIYTIPLDLHRYFGQLPRRANSASGPNGSCLAQVGLLDWPQPPPNEPIDERLVPHLKSNELRVDFGSQ